MIFDLKKPIYGSCFGIWDKWLNKAGHRWIVVNTPFGKVTFPSAKAYKLKSKRIERYYKNPQVPMVFYAMSFLPEIKERAERKKKEGNRNEYLKARRRLAEIARQKGIVKEKVEAREGEPAYYRETGESPELSYKTIGV